MLRLLVLALLLANAGYLAWTHGLLADYGFAPAAPVGAATPDAADPARGDAFAVGRRGPATGKPSVRQALTGADANLLCSYFHS